VSDSNGAVISVLILASGRGSNFEAIAKGVESGELRAKIVGVFSDKKDAGVLERAKKFGIETRASSRNFESGLLKMIAEKKPHFLVCAGFMRILSPRILDLFQSPCGRYFRVVNVHPSLLPSFPGLRAYSKAFHYGVKLCGASIHFVTSELDQGPILAQEAFSIDECESEAEVEAKGLEVEHRLYQETLKWVLPEKFKIDIRKLEDGQERLNVRKG